MRSSWIVATCLAVLCLAVVTASAASSLKITEMAVTTKLVKGNPIDSVWRISSSSVKALYCFTRISSPTDDETTITHQWFKNDELIAESELPVRGKHWRTYSKRPIDRNSAGDWRVEARDSAGNLVQAVSFRIN